MSGQGQFLTGQYIARIAAIYHQWLAGANDHAPLHAIITGAEAARNDYNFSPSRYVSVNGKEEVLALEEAVVHLLEVEEERAEADRRWQRCLTN